MISNPATHLPLPLLLLACGCGSPAPSVDPSTQSSGGDETAASDTSGGSVADPALSLQSFDVRYDAAVDALIFELEVDGDAGAFAPEPAGSVDGAPVTGYVFPTTLAPATVGFTDVEGTLVLAVTSHPDFDDTPLWDEDGNRAYDDDGVVYHAHWAVLVEDDRAPAGLAVAQAPDPAVLPPSAPMPMYLDSPGFTIVEDGHHLRVVVPFDRVRRTEAFDVGALTAQMRVNVIDGAPLLSVESILSSVDDGAATRTPTGLDSAAARAWPAAADDAGTLDLTATDGSYRSDLGTFVLSMDSASAIATSIPDPAGSLDGAPVLGYVFPTSIDPAKSASTGPKARSSWP